MFRSRLLVIGWHIGIANGGGVIDVCAGSGHSVPQQVNSKRYSKCSFFIISVPATAWLILNPPQGYMQGSVALIFTDLKRHCDILLFAILLNR